MPNRLALETSPYLLQHANNPVDWFPWGPEALQKANTEDKPIFLSIGYSACHWCHVMEHESFEDADIARLLNDNFVSIKVDREERPDLDQVYMQAVMALRGGQGGWPLSVFLSPEQHVFFGGTYWPPRSRMNMPGFVDVLRRVLEAFRTVRPQITKQSLQITEWLNESPAETTATADASTLQTSIRAIEHDFDFDYGGFGTEPKFPHASTLRFLIRTASSAATRKHPSHNSATVEQMVRLNLDGMRRGGIYDQIGGGFARYSVDRKWLVPHFEKMLYDNALLTSVYLEAYQAIQEVDYATVARETLDFLLREMHDPLGGFHSSLDADSEGEEGKYYVWSLAEVAETLAPDSQLIAEFFGVTRHGNFEGHNILFLPCKTQSFATAKGISVEHLQSTIAAARPQLLARRESRIRPHKDDKVIASWNALAISAFADGARILGDERYLDAARQAAAFTFDYLHDSSGRMLRCFRQGVAKPLAFLDDYAYTLVALLDLYAASFEELWIDRAAEVAARMLDLFSDPTHGLLYFVGRDQDQLISRMKDQQDSSIPSGNSIAAEGLIRLGRLSGDAGMLERGLAILRDLSPLMSRAPLAASQGLVALQLATEPNEEFVVVVKDANDATEVKKLLQESWNPLASIMLRKTANVNQTSPRLDHAFAGREPIGGAPTLYHCTNFACQQPIIGLSEIASALSERKQI